MATQDPGSSISIYAEVLFNIRQISVVVSLPSPADGSTRVLLENAQFIRVYHKDQLSSLTLPSRTHGSSVLPVPEPEKKQTILNWRLTLSTEIPKPSTISLENQALPWSAIDINNESPLQCRKCRHEIVRRGTIKVWKDLPSENWAEMMEFWHCHKPHDHERNLGDEALEKRGYGASNVISAQPTVGFVDLTSFLISESDCNGLLVSVATPASLPLVPGVKKLAKLALTGHQCSGQRYKPPRVNHMSCPSDLGGWPYQKPSHQGMGSGSKAQATASFFTPTTRAVAVGGFQEFSHSPEDPGFESSTLAQEQHQDLKWILIFCKECRSEVGLYNVSISSLSLFKWQTLCETKLPSPAPSEIHCLSATLTATISRTGSSKFVILPHLRTSTSDDVGGSESKALHLWVMNPHVVYASSRIEKKCTAMKILFQVIDAEKGNKLADNLSSDIQDISLPLAVITEAEERLYSSSLFLPEKDRVFKEWSIGLLERWDSHA